MIARLYPIIESSYLYKLDKQRHNLRFYSTMSSLLVLALAIALFSISARRRSFRVPGGSWRRLRRSSSA